MKYALNLADSGRVLSATFEQYAPVGAVITESLPVGHPCDYLYVDGTFIHDPLPVPVDPEATPTKLDVLEAQVTYTAMMTDTLLEV